MIGPAVLDAMLAAGCTAEQIVAAVKADAAVEEQRKSEKRAKDADRQRRHRSSRTVTVTPCDTRDDPSPLVPPPNTPHTPQITPPYNPPNRGTRLPGDWQPGQLSGKSLDAVRLHGMAWRDTELEKFRNHWRASAGKSGVKRDWQAAWANWILQADDWAPRNRAPPDPDASDGV